MGRLRNRLVCSFSIRYMKLFGGGSVLKNFLVCVLNGCMWLFFGGGIRFGVLIIRFSGLFFLNIRKCIILFGWVVRVWMIMLL